MTSPHWNLIHVFKGLRTNALGVMLFSICLAFLGLLLYTSNILMTLIALQVVIYSIATDMTLLCIKGFQNGPIELLMASLIVSLTTK